MSDLTKRLRDSRVIRLPMTVHDAHELSVLVQQAAERIEAQRRIIDACHHALGESEHSDDDTLAESIARHIGERNERIDALEAELRAAIPMLDLMRLKLAKAEDALAASNGEPAPCCGQFDTCLRPCTPRGQHIGEQALAGAIKDRNTMQAQMEGRLDVAQKALAAARAEGFAWKEQPTRDDVRAALIFCLWHHQGGSSKIGQPIRAALGIAPHAHLTDAQLAAAKRVQSALAAQRAPAEPVAWRWRWKDSDQWSMSVVPHTDPDAISEPLYAARSAP